MKFSDALSYIRFKTETDETTFPTSEVNLLANLHKNDIVKEVAKINEDYFGIPYTRDLIENQREYDLPVEILNNIKMVEMTLDGINWRRAEEIDLNNYVVNYASPVGDPLNNAPQGGSFSRATTDEASIQANFSDDHPRFEIFRKALWLFTGSELPAVEAGLKLWAIVYPKDFELADWSSTELIEAAPDASTSGIPTQVQKLILDKVVWDYKYRDKPVPVAELQSWEKAMKDAMDAMQGTNLDRETVANIPYNNGAQY